MCSVSVWAAVCPISGYSQGKYVFGASYATSFSTRSTSQYDNADMQAVQLNVSKKFNYLDKYADTYVGGMVVYSHYDFMPDDTRPGIPLDRYGNFVAGGISIRQDFNKLTNNEKVGISSLVENGFGYQFKTKNNTDPMQVQGGHFQIFFNAGLYLNILLNGRNTLMIGPQFSHYSNSRTSTPNNGINSLSIALKYYYSGQDVAMESRKGINVGTRKWYADLTTGIGINALDKNRTGHNNMYASSNSSVAVMYQLNYRKSVGLALDYFNNPSGSLDRKSQFVGVSGRYETDFGRMGVDMRLGRYLNGPHGVSGRTEKRSYIYEGIGMKYYLCNAWNWKPYIGYMVKAIDFHAEYLEIHLGVRI